MPATACQLDYALAPLLLPAPSRRLLPKHLRAAFDADSGVFRLPPRTTHFHSLAAKELGPLRLKAPPCGRDHARASAGLRHVPMVKQPSRSAAASTILARHAGRSILRRRSHCFTPFITIRLARKSVGRRESGCYFAATLRRAPFYRCARPGVMLANG